MVYKKVLLIFIGFHFNSMVRRNKVPYWNWRESLPSVQQTEDKSPRVETKNSSYPLKMRTRKRMIQFLGSDVMS